MFNIFENKLRELLEMQVSFCSTREFKQCSLEVGLRNKSAYKLFLNLGFSNLSSANVRTRWDWWVSLDKITPIPCQPVATKSHKRFRSPVSIQSLFLSRAVRLPGSSRRVGDWSPFHQSTGLRSKLVGLFLPKKNITESGCLRSDVVSTYWYFAQVSYEFSGIQKLRTNQSWLPLFGGTRSC